MRRAQFFCCGYCRNQICLTLWLSAVPRRGVFVWWVDGTSAHRSPFQEYVFSYSSLYWWTLFQGWFHNATEARALQPACYFIVKMERGIWVNLTTIFQNFVTKNILISHYFVVHTNIKQTYWSEVVLLCSLNLMEFLVRFHRKSTSSSEK